MTDPFTPEGSGGHRPAGRDGDTRLGSESYGWKQKKVTRFKGTAVAKKYECRIGNCEENKKDSTHFVYSAVSVSDRLQQAGVNVSTWSAAGLTSPALTGEKTHIDTTDTRNVTFYAKHSKNQTVPAALRSMCRCRWHPGTPSATGFPPDTFFHHHSTPSRLCFR